LGKKREGKKKAEGGYLFPSKTKKGMPIGAEKYGNASLLKKKEKGGGRRPS